MNYEELHYVGVMGGGIMGSGIAQSVALTGKVVVVRDISPDALSKAQQAIETGRYGLANGVERGKISAAQAERARAGLSYTTELADLRDCDLVIEAVPEKLELKQQIFADLEDLVRPDAILASNTSGFAIADVGAQIKRKDRVIGMHWFSPANVMRAVEVIVTPDTSKDTAETLYDLCEAMGKVTVRVKDQPGAYGFVGNRIYFELVKAAQRVLEEEIVSEEDLNAVFRYGFGWPVGPLEMGRGAQAGWE